MCLKILKCGCGCCKGCRGKQGAAASAHSQSFLQYTALESTTPKDKVAKVGG